MSTDTARLAGADIEVRCLCGCKTRTVEEAITVDLWFNADEKRYHVTFEDDFTTVYIQDHLCFKADGPVCSVKGTLPNGTRFAFACLTKRGEYGKTGPDQAWVSHPGPDGLHFAIKGPIA